MGIILQFFALMKGCSAQKPNFTAKQCFGMREGWLGCKKSGNSRNWKRETRKSGAKFSTGNFFWPEIYVSSKVAMPLPDYISFYTVSCIWTSNFEENVSNKHLAQGDPTPSQEICSYQRFIWSVFKNCNPGIVSSIFPPTEPMKETSQELRMLSTVTLDCQVT